MATETATIVLDAVERRQRGDAAEDSAGAGPEGGPRPSAASTSSRGDADAPRAREASVPPTHLRLRLVPPRRKKKMVSWNDGVVDNENLGRKSSKSCCIYHRPRRFDESSSEEDSSEDEREAGGAKGKAPARRRRRRKMGFDPNCEECAQEEGDGARAS